MYEQSYIAAWRRSIAYGRHRVGRIVSGRDGDPASARSVSHDRDPLWDHRDHLRRLARARGGATSAKAGGARTAGCAVGYGWLRRTWATALCRSATFAARAWRDHHGHTAAGRRGRGLVASWRAPGAGDTGISRRRARRRVAGRDQGPFHGRVRGRHRLGRPDDVSWRG